MIGGEGDSTAFRVDDGLSGRPRVERSRGKSATVQPLYVLLYVFWIWFLGALSCSGLPCFAHPQRSASRCAVPRRRAQRAGVGQRSEKLLAQRVLGSLGARPGFARIWLLRFFRSLAFLAQARK